MRFKISACAALCALLLASGDLMIGGRAHAGFPPDPLLVEQQSVYSGAGERNLGLHMAADGSTMAAIANGPNDPFSVYRFTRQGGEWGNPQHLPGPFSGNDNGRLDVSGSVIVHGGRPLGTVAVFDGLNRTDVTEAQAATVGQLREPGSFGRDVGIDHDVAPGVRRLVVGAPTTRDGFNHLAGGVFVFEDAGSGWQGIAALAGIVSGRRLGNRVAISGRYVIAAGVPASVSAVSIWDVDGAPADSDTVQGFGAIAEVGDVDIRGRWAVASAGSQARVYHRDSGVWQEALILDPPGQWNVLAVAIKGSHVLLGGEGHVALYDLSGALVGVSQMDDFIEPDTLGAAVALAGSSALAAQRINRRIIDYDTAGACETMTATPSSLSFSAAAGSQTFAVDVEPAGCAWNVRWPGAVTFQASPMSGVGDGSVTVTVPNRTVDSPVTLRLRMSAGGRVRVRQFGVGATNCSQMFLDSYSRTVDSTGASFDVAVNTPGGQCSWTVSSSEVWLDASPAIGAGDQTVTITAEQNSGSTGRAGIVTIGSREFTITQNPAGFAIDCGSEVVSDTTLEADIDCTGMGADEIGLTLAAGVTLDLNGNDVLGPGLGVAGAVGVLMTGALAEVIDGAGGTTAGAIAAFEFGAAAIDPSTFPCPSFSSITDGSCFARRPPGSAQVAPATATVTGVRFEDNLYALLAIASNLIVRDAVFVGNRAGATYLGSDTSATGSVDVRTSSFVDNYVGVDVETGVDLRLENNLFRDNIGSGALVIDTTSMRIIGNTFLYNNSDTDEGKFLGQLSLKPSTSDGVIRCNVFRDVAYEGTSALDLDGMGAPRPGHGGIGITRERDTASIDIVENDFERGDVGVFFYDTQGAGHFQIINNNFSAGLKFNVGIHDGFVSPRTLAGSGNYLANSRPIVSDPSGTGFASNTVSALASSANACSLRIGAW
jgi:hypothetical protein